MRRVEPAAGLTGEFAMTDFALPGSLHEAAAPKRPNLDKGFNPLTMIIFGVLAAGLLFVAYSLYVDVGESGAGAKPATWLPFILLFVALLIALGFEFVNGFHDTANAVATVIYTHCCRPKWRWCGRASSISSACCCQVARWRSASSRSCRSS
jgi:hypothetical protein